MFNAWITIFPDKNDHNKLAKKFVINGGSQMKESRFAYLKLTLRSRKLVKETNRSTKSTIYNLWGNYVRMIRIVRFSSVDQLLDHFTMTCSIIISKSGTTCCYAIKVRAILPIFHTRYQNIPCQSKSILQHDRRFQKWKAKFQQQCGLAQWALQFSTFLPPPWWSSGKPWHKNRRFLHKWIFKI